MVQNVRGNPVYFGTDAALAKYLDERDDLQAGRQSRRRRSELTIRDLVNQYLEYKLHLVETGELSRTFSGYHSICSHIVTHFRDRAVDGIALPPVHG